MVNGKGSKPRPMDRITYESNFADIFKRKIIECPSCERTTTYRGEDELTCEHCKALLSIHKFKDSTIICNQSTKSSQRSFSMVEREGTSE